MLAAGRNAAGQQGAPPSSVPAGYLPAYGSPYTGGSPYDPMFEQTYNDNGTWFSDQRSGFGAFSKPRKFFLNMDYTNTKTRKLHGIFGSPTSQSYYQQNDPDSDEIIDDLSFYRYFDAAGGSLPVADSGMWTGLACYWTLAGRWMTRKHLTAERWKPRRGWTLLRHWH